MVTASLPGFVSKGVIHHRDYYQCQQSGNQNAEYQCDGQAIEDWVVEYEKSAEDGGQRGEGNRSGAYCGGLNDGLF